MKEARSYLVTSALACGVMYWVLDLSSSGRTAIDWAVISLVTLAILWSLVQLGRRLYQGGGGKAVWHLTRTLMFWIIGLFNTALIRPEEVGTWKNYLGWALLVVAVFDTVALYWKERSLNASHPREAPAS